MIQLAIQQSLADSGSFDVGRSESWVYQAGLSNSEENLQRYFSKFQHR